MGDCSSELKDLSEDLSLLGLQKDSVELQGGSVDLTRISESVEGVTDLSPEISQGFFCTTSDSMERMVRVFDSELTDETINLSARAKFRDSGRNGVTARLDVNESGPMVSPELKDLVLSGVLGLRLTST